jgi:aldose 1-epimerase
MNSIKIELNNYVARINTEGCALTELKFGTRDLVEPSISSQYFSGALLAPWPNRIRDGKYSWKGYHFQAPINEIARNNNLHALVFNKEWAVVEQTHSSVILSLSLKKSVAYPTDLDFLVTYSLSGEGLHWQIDTKNIGILSAPFGVSVHPYLIADPGIINDVCILKMAASHFMEVDDLRLLPTGVMSVEGTDFDFRNGRIIGTQFIDHAFLMDEQKSRIEFYNLSGTGVWISSDENAKWCQIHTADRDGSKRSRMQLAVEPMTCAADSFNSKEDVIELAPGEIHSMYWKIGALVNF